MPAYRAYLVDPHTSRFTHVEPFEAPDDVRALERAKQLVNGHDVELWQAARQIARLSSKD
jgi:hypothetical protein